MFGTGGLSSSTNDQTGGSLSNGGQTFGNLTHNSPNPFLMLGMVAAISFAIYKAVK